MSDTPAEYSQQYESQYVTDLAGALIRVEDATRDDLKTIFTLTIDGQAVEVPKAVPFRDDQGNVRRDASGRVEPRLSTVYDAVSLRYGETTAAGFRASERKNPVPLLCHQCHLEPVGVCRVCSCLTIKKGEVGEKLIPACQHPIVDGMEVHTIASTKAVRHPSSDEAEPAGAFIERGVKVLLGLLAANSLHEERQGPDRRYDNELLALCERFGVPLEVRVVSDEVEKPLRGDYFLRPHDQAKIDDSSPVIQVDHNACVLCDRSGGGPLPRGRVRHDGLPHPRGRGHRRGRTGLQHVLPRRRHRRRDGRHVPRAAQGRASRQGDVLPAANGTPSPS